MEKRIFILEHYVKSRSYGETHATIEDTFTRKSLQTSASQKSSIKRYQNKFNATGNAVHSPRKDLPRAVLPKKKVATAFSSKMSV